MSMWPEIVESIEDISVVGDEILVWDGCDWHIDYVEVCPEYGHHYMANGTEVEQWMPLPEPRKTVGDTCE